jgi:diguanylate cyclase (GGDEF)-like protein/PAS domain S-box-containing protein
VTAGRGPQDEVEVGRALDLLRAARRLTAELSAARPLADTLQAVVEGVAGLGFDGAVMNLVREDGDLEVVATAGPEGLCSTLQGVVERRGSWDRLLAAGERWGSLVYVPADVGRALTGQTEMVAWYAQGGDRTGPDAWPAGSDLFAPMTDRQGRLLGVLSVGDPDDLRVPGPDRLELFEMYAAHAAVAVENARLREVAERALAGLEREREHFRQAFELAPTGMAVFRPGDHGSLRVNEALCRMVGRSREELLSLPLISLVHPEDRDDALRGVHLEIHAVPRRYLHADGGLRWMSVSGVTLDGGSSGESWRLMHLVDITDARKREEVLRHDAWHDPLTGLANRRGLEAAMAAGPPGRALAVFFVDLDGFKAINDAHGHDVGDLVLVEVGRRLARAVRGGDVVARLGGDEFVALGWDLDEPAAAAVAQRFGEVLVPPVFRPRDGTAAGHADVPELAVGASVGYAVGEPGDDPAELLARADRRMLRRKRRQARGRPRAR